MVKAKLQFTSVTQSCCSIKIFLLWRLPQSLQTLTDLFSWTLTVMKVTSPVTEFSKFFRCRTMRWYEVTGGALRNPETVTQVNKVHSLCYFNCYGHSAVGSENFHILNIGIVHLLFHIFNQNYEGLSSS